MAQAQALSAEDRLELACALYASVDIPATDEELDEAITGLRVYRNDPSAVHPWADVMADLRSRYAC